MLIASRNGTISAGTLIIETRYTWTLLVEKQEVRVSKSDTHERAFEHMADALQWAGADPELIAHFSGNPGGSDHGQAPQL